MELERQLKLKKATISANTAIEIAETIHEKQLTFQTQIKKLKN